MRPTLVLLLLGLVVGMTARAQAPAGDPAPAVPPQGLPTPAVPAPAGSREAQLEERIRQLEAMYKKLSTKVDQMERAGGPGTPGTTGLGAGAGGGARDPNSPSTLGNTAAGGTGVGGSSDTGSTGVPGPLGASGNASSGALAPGQSVTQVPAPRPDISMPPAARKDVLQGTFGPGFMLKTDDDEYVVQFHNLTQIQYVTYGQGGQDPVHDTFGIPRQWFMLSGRITKPIEYFLSIQDAFDTILPLDIFVNVNFDERLQFKFGRFKTPFTYEFYQEPIQGLVNTERSLFFNNFALNRQVGAQVWGQLFRKRLTYTVGAFNTTQNGNLDSSDGKDLLAYLSYKPFVQDEGNFFQFLDVGGSVDQGSSQVNTPIPQTLRTNQPTTGNTIVGVPFLSFNNNVRKSGPHTLWSMHTAFYRDHLSLIGEWQGGFQDYALSTSLQSHTRVPIRSFYVMGGYFLTGETVSGRNVVRPNRNFDVRGGRQGLGAIELMGRYNYLNVGKDVFSAGLADPNLWSNSLYTTDAGVNWYWNTYVKWVFDWQHAAFGSPVQYAPGKSQLTSETFWIRFQLYF